ncbi:MAG: hypothetical protein P1P82_02285 [Bacteroidales bacterium]|nr:hypothetical protein [Bacteroidales bacterium]MDT8431125.1 hypothetical protein [Bacteroidales bacterium]
MKTMISVLFAALIAQGIHAQTDTFFRQNSIQVHASAMFFYVAGANFETYLWEKPKTVSGISFGAGYFSDGGIEVPVHIYTLWNKTSVHHLELDYGINLLVDPQDRFLPLPTLSLGYRYQNLSRKGFLIRGGLNLWIIPYLSIGYAF